MRYINRLFSYLLTFLLTEASSVGESETVDDKMAAVCNYFKAIVRR